MYAQSDTISNA